jgi:hypothetical protein
MNVERQPVFNVRIVRANRGGTFTTTADFGVGDMMATVTKAEELQAEIDQDCDPARVYVVAPDGIPVHAAGALESKWTRYYADWQQRRRRGPYRAQLRRN